ncbi:SMODS domain-containing nucleotidyltransferase [Candidatus Pristimantibacillus sp. PTI5]|uniref:SMODS domain-containing nucleotidyltransferase n=1 Tax=Candidatus Pristimantibacillus sp. PTI5 TaxID=3400422 RepID=UPI003B028392
MAQHALSANFAYFFNRLNPSPSFVTKASSEHSTITSLIENPLGLASELSPICFLQGSYKQQTAIYTINDVDIVVVCRSLIYPSSSSQSGDGGNGVRYWSRNEIFNIIAAPLLNDGRYRSKVRYNDQSMCIKVDLGIKVEILPVVQAEGNDDSRAEPFYLFRPHTGNWETGYARDHQAYLSAKNRDQFTYGNFIPAIKTFKHIRTVLKLDVVSFHLECLLFSIPNQYYHGSAANYLHYLLSYIANYTAEAWYESDIKTPCEDRELFDETEWKWENWSLFHKFVIVLSRYSKMAVESENRDFAISCWKEILGDSFFPMRVST